VDGSGAVNTIFSFNSKPVFKSPLQATAIEYTPWRALCSPVEHPSLGQVFGGKMGKKLLAAVTILLWLLEASQPSVAAGHADEPEGNTQSESQPQDKSKLKSSLTDYRDLATKQLSSLNKSRTPEVLRDIYKGSFVRFRDRLTIFDQEYRELLSLLSQHKEQNLFPERILAENLRNQRLRYLYGLEAKRFDNICDVQQLQGKGKVESRCQAKLSNDPLLFLEVLTTQSTMDYQDPAVQYGTTLIRLMKKSVEEKVAGKLPSFDYQSKEGREKMRLEALRQMQKDYVGTTEFNMFTSLYQGEPMGDLVQAAGAKQHLLEVYRLLSGRNPQTNNVPNPAPVSPESNLDRISRVSLAIWVRNLAAPVAEWRQMDEDRRNIE